jgi:tetratricopeptide (TPR) repeat protein
MNSSMRTPWLVGALLATAVLSACGSAESRKARYVQHGKDYLAASNYDKARVEFRNAAQIDPNDADVRYLLGQVAERENDIRDAVGQYRAAISQNPKHLPARAALGRLFLFGGVPDKALEMVEPGLTADPQNAQLLTVRGGARAQLGDMKAAYADAELAVKLAPGDAYAIGLLASLYRKDQQLDKAVAVVQSGLKIQPASVELRVMLADLQLAQQHPDQAEAQLRQIIALQPKVLEHRYRLAYFYLQQKNVAAAEKTVREAVRSAPDDVPVKVRLVEFLASQRGKDQAAAQVDQFTAQEPGNDNLKLAMAELLAQIGLGERAERDFRAVIAHAGTTTSGLSARDKLAALLLARNDVAGAAALIAEVLKENARDNEALVLRGKIALARGNIKEAITDLRAVLRDQPNAVPLMRLLARAYQADGELDQAEQTLRAAVQVAPQDFETRLDFAQALSDAKKYDQAAPLLEQLTRETPTNMQVQERLFRVQVAQGHTAEAAATATRIKGLRPDLGLGYYLGGVAAESNQNYDDAAKGYAQALERQPKTAEPLTALVRLQMQRKRVAEAMAAVTGAIAKYPDNVVAHNLKGEILLSEGQTEAAVKAFQETIQLAPAIAGAYHSLALAQFTAKRPQDAVRTLQLGIEKTQSDVALVGDLGGLYVRLGRPAEAIALYEGVLAKNPTSLFAANNLAMLLVTHRQDAASLVRAQKLAEQLASSTQAGFTDTRGWVKFKSGDFHGAEILLQQAVEAAPDAPELRYHLGMAQLRGGEPQAAQQNLEMALRTEQPFPGRDEAKAALTQLKKAPHAG